MSRMAMGESDLARRLRNTTRRNRRDSESRLLISKNSGNPESRFGAAHVFEAIVGADRDGVLAAGCAAPRQADGKFVALFRRVADSVLWHHDNPVAAVDAILSTLDAASRIARHEVNCRHMVGDTTCLRTAQLCF